VNIKLRLDLLYLQNTKDSHCTDFVTLILENVWYTSIDQDNKSSVLDDVALPSSKSCVQVVWYSHLVFLREYKICLHIHLSFVPSELVHGD
jgi:hypothetical protein